ncbi:MAG: DUF4097 domain-containing protein [Clostridiales bacterium]|nr:DUF4097 domain-containing protein [Clostridiales bacterium]
MSKFVKGCLITALICVCLGVVVLGAAVSAGGINEIRRLAEEGAMSCENGIFDFVYGGTDGSWDFNGGGTKQTWELTEQETAQIQNLKIDIEGGNLTILSGNEKYIHAEYNDAKAVKLSVHGDTLEVKTTEKRNRLYERKIRLYIPNDMKFEEIVCDWGAGKVGADVLYADRIELDGGAGEIEIAELNCQKLTGDIGAGSMELENARIEEGEIEVGAGQFEYEGSIGRNMSVDCSAGGALLNLQNRMEDFNYRLDVSVGEICIGEESYSGLDATKEIDHGAGRKLDLSCSVGSVQVEFEE